MFTENASPKESLRHFNEEERRYVFLDLADGKSLKEIVDLFQYRFPEFGCGVDRAALKPKLYERVRNLKRNHSDEISTMAEITDVDIPGIITTDGKDPFTLYVACSFAMFYRIWLDTPPKVFRRVCVDSRGRKRKIYQFLTRERLQILVDAEKLAREVPETYLPQQIPLTDPMFRVKALEQLLCETPIKSFLRYSRKDAKDIYTSHVKILLKVLEQARIESQCLPESYEMIAFPQTTDARTKILKLSNDAENIDSKGND